MGVFGERVGRKGPSKSDGLDRQDNSAKGRSARRPEPSQEHSSPGPERKTAVLSLGTLKGDLNCAIL